MLIHERIDIGLSRVIQMLSNSGKPLSEFLPSWYAWIEESEDDEGEEAGQMLATMRAMASKWQKKNEGVNDGGISERARGADNRRRDGSDGSVRSGDGSDGGLLGGN